MTNSRHPREEPPRRDESETTPSRRRRDRERAVARERILAAALDVARRDGWDAVTMRRLAGEIEYSANFAYRYFAGRDDILHALVREGFARLEEAMTAASRQVGPDAAAAGTSGAGGASTAAVRSAGHAYLDVALADPGLYQLMYGLGGVRVTAADTWSEGQNIGDTMTELLADTGDPHAERHVLQLWATAHGLVALLVVGRVDIDVDGLHALLESAMTDCLTRALSGLDEPGHPPDLTEGTNPSP